MLDSQPDLWPSVSAGIVDSVPYAFRSARPQHLILFTDRLSWNMFGMLFGFL